MGFDPQKLFIGVVDFFAVLMPGALLAYFGRYWTELPFQLKGPEGWIVFFFASYLLGHFAFLFGTILDEIIYAPFRSATNLKKVFKDGERSVGLARALHPYAASRWFFGKHADEAVEQARLIKQRALGGVPEGTINTYQWCKARLSIAHPQGLVAVQRLEADSKFFRSLVVVLALFTVVNAVGLRPLLASLCLVGLVLAVWRYIELRFKGTQQAYWLVITLDGAPAKSTGAPASPPARGRKRNAS